MSDLVQIDGSFGEGGGQVLRTSLSLAAITGRPVEVVNIRGGRAKPGLQAQHLASVRAAAEICGARTKGDAAGSLYLLFEPCHEVQAGDYRFDIGTAGATTLVAQTVIVPLSLASEGSAVTVTGGTHNPMAPTADYLEHVYVPALAETGYRVRGAYGPPGFFPRGGGELRLLIEPAVKRHAISIDERVAVEFAAHVVTGSLPPTVAERAGKVIAERLKVKARERVETCVSTGAAVTIATKHAGFSALGERGKPMERVASEAVDDAQRWRQGSGTVDEHLADQLVLPALFASGASRWRTPRVTEHLRTVLWVARHFLDFEASIDEESGLVVIEG